MPTTNPTEPIEKMHSRRSLTDLWPVAAAVVAAVVLVTALVIVLGGGGGDGVAADDEIRVAHTAQRQASPEPDVPALRPTPTAKTVEADAPSEPTRPTLPEVEVPRADPSPTPPPPTPVEPAGPQPVLDVVDHHVLEPGTHGFSLYIENEGDAALEFVFANDGDGYTSLVPNGVIPANDAVHAWVEMDVAPEGVGPTPFQRTMEIQSNGGDVSVLVEGQVEAPGELRAVAALVGLVDYRATVQFENAGGLPLDITAVSHPGLVRGPLPDQIGAGEIISIEVMVCGTTAHQLPVNIGPPVLPPGQPHQFGSTIVVETDENSAATTLHGVSLAFAPPSCEPNHVSPTNDLAS